MYKLFCYGDLFLVNEFNIFTFFFFFLSIPAYNRNFNKILCTYSATRRLRVKSEIRLLRRSLSSSPLLLLFSFFHFANIGPVFIFPFLGPTAVHTASLYTKLSEFVLHSGFTVSKLCVLHSLYRTSYFHFICFFFYIFWPFFRASRKRREGI